MLRRFQTFAIILALALCTGALAHSPSYDSSGDTHINLNLPLLGSLTSALPLGGVGSLLFNTQEAVHSTLTGLTGIRLPHDYLWTCAGRLCLPVDPLRFGR